MADFEKYWRCACGNLNPEFSGKCAKCGKGKWETDYEYIYRCRNCGNCLPASGWGPPSQCPSCG